MIRTFPRFGKSYLLDSTAPIFRALTLQDYECLIVTYGADLAKDFNRACRDKFGDVCHFLSNGTILPDPNIASAESWHTKGKSIAKVKSAGISGRITGLGGDDIYLDDLLKGADEVDSEATLKSIYAKLTSDIQSRVFPNGLIIMIGTPWAENDPFGFARTHWKNNIMFDLGIPVQCYQGAEDPLAHQNLVNIGIVKPGELVTYSEKKFVTDNYMESLVADGAIIIEDPEDNTRYRITQKRGRVNGQSAMGPHLGDTNLPRKICNDNQWVQDKKAIVLAGLDEDNITGMGGKRTWDALYQVSPTGVIGGMFKPEHIQSCKYDSLDKKINVTNPTFFSIYINEGYTYLSIDCSFKKTETSDYMAIGAYTVWNNMTFKWGQWNKRVDFGAAYKLIVDITKQYEGFIDDVLIEDKANGPAIISSLRTIWYDTDKTTPGKYVLKKGNPAIHVVQPQGDKSSRAQAILPYMEQNNFYVCENMIGNSDDSGDLTTQFKDQLFKFPYGAHDDMVDETTQALVRAIKMITGEVPKPNKNVYKNFTTWHPAMWDDYRSIKDEDLKAEFIKKYGVPIEWKNSGYTDERG
jgi:phage terminase large subunit-like protein